jgi:hypothetical protein
MMPGRGHCCRERAATVRIRRIPDVVRQAASLALAVDRDVAALAHFESTGSERVVPTNRG